MTSSFSSQLYKKLKGGTERAYSALAFNDKGDMLASVGGNPDFMLSLWDWETEGIILRCKAFSQDVYTVSFSPYFEGNLTTSGTGHIRFWKMASTFTGLKLQVRGAQSSVQRTSRCLLLVTAYHLQNSGLHSRRCLASMAGTVLPKVCLLNAQPSGKQVHW